LDVPCRRVRAGRFRIVEERRFSAASDGVDMGFSPGATPNATKA